MASKVFKIDEVNDNQHSSSSWKADNAFWKCGNIAEALPSSLVCWKKTPRQRGIQKAQKALKKEMDILKLVKSIRYLKGAVRRLLPDKATRKNLKDDTEYLTVYPDEDDPSDSNVMKVQNDVLLDQDELFNGNSDRQVQNIQLQEIVQGIDFDADHYGNQNGDVDKLVDLTNEPTKRKDLANTQVANLPG